MKAPAGKWCPNAVRLNPRGPVVWIDHKGGGIGRTVGTVNGEAMVTSRKVSGGHVCSIVGWDWKITPDMGAHRFTQIPGGRDLTHAPNKFFKTVRAMKREAEAIYKTLGEVDGAH